MLATVVANSWQGDDDFRWRMCLVARLRVVMKCFPSLWMQGMAQRGRPFDRFVAMRLRVRYSQI